MIPVTKAYLPSKQKYQSYVDRIFESGWLTNNGSLLQELESRLAEYLGVKNIILVANGSFALQLAYKALELTGEVITTPFSFAATTSTLAWEGLTPIFADIDPDSFNIDPAQIEAQITPQTSAIVPVHVFGNPCDVETIQIIADKHNLKVIYDAAHAFGSEYKGKSVLNYGDVSILSFHSTKLFHTIEGGAVITNDDDLAKRIRMMINFGISSPTSIASVGTNAKMNEFEAAMGLCVLDDIDYIQEQRANIWKKYTQSLASHFTIQKWNEYGRNNHAYAPILFNNEEQLLKVEARLKENNILGRRYFYPSLDTLDYLDKKQVCENSRDIASRILCIPIYPGLRREDISSVISYISESTLESIEDKVSDSELLTYLKKIELDFHPKLSAKTSLDELSIKINLLGNYSYILSKNEIVAFISYYLNEDFAYINIMHVSDVYRGLGIASRLLKSLFNKLSSSSCKYIRLEVSTNNDAAITLYKKLGFVVVEKNSPTLSKVYMEKKL